MAEINDIDLRLNILADDKASETLKTLTGVMDTLRESLASFKDLNPFAQLMDDADAFTGSIQDLRAQVVGLRDELDTLGASPGLAQLRNDIATIRAEVASTEDVSGRNPFASWQLGDLQSALRQSIGEVDQLDSIVKDNPFTTIVTSVSQLTAELGIATSEATRLVEVMAGASMGGGRSGGSRSSSPSQQALNSWFAGINQSTLTAEQRAEYARAANNDVAGFYSMYGSALGGPTVPGGTSPSSKSGIPSWLKNVNGMSGMLSELPMKMLYGGMNAMMGYYGLQALANGTSGFASIQQLMNLNNSTVDQAAQYQMMLGSAGLTGTSGVSFLQGLTSNMQKTFTPAVGSGALSQNAILLESLGITKQDITQSPMMLLSTIGTRYRQLLGQGRGSQASELLNLTGTTQVASLLQNWQSISQQTSGTKLNMTPQQLNQAVQQNVTMQVSMQQLNLAFEQMAITLVPLVTKLTSAITDLMNAFHAGKGPVGDTVQGLTSAAKDLGTFATSVIGAAAALKGISFVSDILSGAGIIGDVGGGLTLGKIIGKGAKGIGGLFGAGGAEAGAAGGEAAGAAAGASGLVTGGAIGALVAFGAWWKQMGSMNGPIYQALGKMNQSIVKWASDTTGTFTTWITQTWGDLQGWSSKTGGSINSWIDTTNANIGAWVSKHTSDLLTWTQTTGTSIGTWTSTHTADILGWTTKTGASISAWTSQHTADIGKWTQQTGNDISQWTAAHTKDIGTWAQQTGASIGTWAQVHTQDIGQWASQTGQSINGWINQVGPDITNWANQSGQAFTGWYNSTIGIITGWVHSIASLFGVAMNNVSNSATTAANWMTQAWQNVKNFAGGVFGGGGAQQVSASGNAATVWNFLAGKGLSAGAVAGIMGNFQQESGMNPNAPGGGLAQWIGGRQTALQDYAKQTGGNANALTTQLGYLWKELSSGAYGSLSALNSMNATNAAQYFEQMFEKAGIPMMGNRINYANEYYKQFTSGSPGSSQIQYGPTIPKLAMGGIVSGPTLALIGEAGPEVVLPMNRYPVNAGSVGALGMGGGGASGGATFNVQINIPGLGSGAAQIRELAQQVATEFVNQVKRRGNFDWS